MSERLKLPGRDDPKANILRLVYSWLSDEGNGPWLMVLDNVDDESVFFSVQSVTGGVLGDEVVSDPQLPLETFLPQSPNGSILITSRNLVAASNLVDTLGKLVSVKPMEEEDSISLLKTRVSPEKSSESDLKELAQALEGIPLAITHAAAYIRSRPRVNTSVYLSLFRESEANQASLLNNNETKDLRRDHSIRHAVLTTWQISFDQIQKTKNGAVDLLALMSMFDRQGIPERLLHYNNTDQLEFEDALAPLISFSLVREQSTGGGFEMHRLVQLSTRKWVELNGQLKRWQSEALKVVATLFPTGDYETWSDCQTLLPHVREVMSRERTGQGGSLDGATINNSLGYYLMKKGEFTRAIVVLQDAIMAREEMLGVNHLDTLSSVSNLASVLFRQGRYEEAESMNRRALEGYEKELRVNHPNTLTSVSNLAWVLLCQGRYEEAESMNRRALEGREKELRVNHPSTLTSVGNLASVLFHQGRYEEAESLNRRALGGREKELGVNHPDTLSSVSNLASVLFRQGRYEEAESMNRRALEGYEKELRVNHPNTLTSVINLASVLQSQGRYKEAESMNRRALEGYEKEIGVNHPHTLSSVSNLASVLRSQGRYEEAELMNRRTLEGYEKGLGVNHPSTLTSVSMLASVLQSQGRYEEAESMNRRALEGREKELRVNHPDTLYSVYSLASLLTSRRQYQPASELYQKACHGYEIALGPDHPTTLACREHYSLQLAEQRASQSK
jgi:tetratricopeptide (TPR) repeat protein